jgi:hypothetical protein
MQTLLVIFPHCLDHREEEMIEVHAKLRILISFCYEPLQN